MKNMGNARTVKEIAAKLGINHEYILQNYKKLFENTDNDDLKFKVNTKMGDIIETTKPEEGDDGFGKFTVYRSSNKKIGGDDSKLLDEVIEDAEIEEESG